MGKFDRRFNFSWIKPVGACSTILKKSVNSGFHWEVYPNLDTRLFQKAFYFV
jgi:hypothetical protein